MKRTVLKAWDVSTGKVSSDEIPGVCTCGLVLFGVSVFSLGNNAYGQCGRPIVEGENFRSVGGFCLCLCLFFYLSVGLFLSHFNEQNCSSKIKS